MDLAARLLQHYKTPSSEMRLGTWLDIPGIARHGVARAGIVSRVPMPNGQALWRHETGANYLS